MSLLNFARRYRAACAGFAAIALLAACGSGGKPSQGGLSAPVPDKDITLTVWTFVPDNSDGGREAYAEVVKAFNEKHPKVKVDIQNIPYPTFWDKLRNASVAGTGPDVVSMYGGEQAYSYRNSLRPLQDALKPALGDLNFVEENYSRNGNLYVVPTQTYAYGLLLNRKKFAAAGLDPKAGLADWDALLKTCETLSGQEMDPISVGWKDGFNFEAFMYMITSQLMDDATLAKWTAADIPIDDKIFTAAATYILEMKEAGCFGDRGAFSRNMLPDATNHFQSAKAAMVVSGGLDDVKTSAKRLGEVDFVPFPQVPTSQFKNMADGGASNGWAIPTWTKNPEAAGAFVSFLGSAPAQKILWERIRAVPNVKSLDVVGSTPEEKAVLSVMRLPDNHTGFSSFPLPVLAVYERNAAPLLSGDMSLDKFTQEAKTAYEQSN
ncbi:ABC transporter substrate-binding protein [Kribbella sp. NPDC050124]|uniref:ABC transporter substrate-binding protein n=1 Tax=Kribbella sp. NPDC050124 TaxID=3364114 RepID=UPI0037B737FB